MSPQPYSQGSIERFIDRTSVEQKKVYDLLCAEFIFEQNLPFIVSERDIYRAYSSALNSTYHTPYPKTIGITLLDQVYESKKGDLITFLANAENLTLVTNGWSNIRHDHIVNYIIVKQDPILSAKLFLQVYLYKRLRIVTI